MEKKSIEISVDVVHQYFRSLQDSICSALELEDVATFQQENWKYHSGGGGCVCILENGQTFEKAGVNFSHIKGNKLPAASTIKRPELAGRQFEAMGVSLVVHPKNPFIPTVHANVRLFYTTKKNEKPIWWFGGGYDLTPYYGFDEDCIHWHSVAKLACDPFGDDVYNKYKKWCDEYFFLSHRNEPRGIGGLFFDDLNQWSFSKTFKFIQSVGNSFVDAYIPIVQKRKPILFTEKNRDFQCYRRGRYVEFNLIHDRGTLFGLQSGGRTESILMSLPPLVQWKYNWQPSVGSEENRLYEHFLKPKDWIKVS